MSEPEVVAVEEAPLIWRVRKIADNSVYGPVDTEMLHSAMRDPEVLRRRLERVPLKRMGTVDEIVKAVLYLASAQAEWASGAVLDLNGASYLRT